MLLIQFFSILSFCVVSGTHKSAVFCLLSQTSLIKIGNVPLTMAFFLAKSKLVIIDNAIVPASLLRPCVMVLTAIAEWNADRMEPHKRKQMFFLLILQ